MLKIVNNRIKLNQP